MAEQKLNALLTVRYSDGRTAEIIVTMSEAIRLELIGGEGFTILDIRTWEPKNNYGIFDSDNPQEA